jgi:hypothetical protein
MFRKMFRTFLRVGTTGTRDGTPNPEQKRGFGTSRNTLRKNQQASAAGSEQRSAPLKGAELFRPREPMKKVDFSSKKNGLLKIIPRHESLSDCGQ